MAGSEWPRVDERSHLETPGSLRMALAPEAVTRALTDLLRAAETVGAHWSLVGGQALIAHGVPRDTLDADALVAKERLGDLAVELCESHAWKALEYDEGSGDYVETTRPTAHFMEDPVLFDLGTERVLYPLRSASGLLVELLAAQHPVEEEMVREATLRRHFGAVVPVAPLGGVLLMKAKADRTKDVAAIEQAAEHLAAPTIEDIVAWARARDAETAADLESTLRTARARRAPTRKEPYSPKRK